MKIIEVELEKMCGQIIVVDGINMVEIVLPFFFHLCLRILQEHPLGIAKCHCHQICLNEASHPERMTYGCLVSLVLMPSIFLIQLRQAFGVFY